MQTLDVPSSPIINAIVIDYKNVWIYVIILLLFIFSAFFAGTETAYSYCNRHRIKVYADDGSKKAKLILKILDMFDTTIITTLIGTNICHVTLSSITTVLFVKLIGDSGSIVSTIIMTILVFFLCDTLPKNIAQKNPDKWMMLFIRILSFFIIIFYPIQLFFNGIVHLFRLFFKEKEDETAFTEEDFQDVVNQIEEEGVLNEEESDIIQNAVDFNDTKVKDIYTKKEDIVAVDIKLCTNDYLRKFLRDVPYTRIPVYDGDINNIIGILHIKTYLKALFKNNNLNVKDILMKPYLVSPQLSIDSIFDGFKEHKTHVAIIKRGHETVGMVTMQDVLEELIGDFDTDNQEVKING